MGLRINLKKAIVDLPEGWLITISIKKGMSELVLFDEKGFDHFLITSPNKLISNKDVKEALEQAQDHETDLINEMLDDVPLDELKDMSDDMYNAIVNRVGPVTLLGALDFGNHADRIEVTKIYIELISNNPDI